MSLKFRIVCATRMARGDFFARAALGRSLSLCRYPGVELRLFAGNSSGLPLVYNSALREARTDPSIMIFIHDDVHLCDFFWPMNMMAALDSFDVAGLAGNRRRLPHQPAWHFVDLSKTWDSPENLSGIVGHGRGFPPSNLSVYGPPLQQVKLLDGVMLAARSQTLISAGASFDERFDFHFYDLDFCRQAEAAGLRMGTAAISVVHESAGAGGTPAWHAAHRKYIEKWGC